MATPKEQRDARANAINTGSSPAAGPLGAPPGAAHAGGTFREGLDAREAVGGDREPSDAKASAEHPPEAEHDLRDASGGVALSDRDRSDVGPDARLESSMGGTSDAGTAADDAAEAAAFHRGLADDKTR